MPAHRARRAPAAQAALFLAAAILIAVSHAVYPGPCGDGVRDASIGEECDDGNVFSGDGCSSTCVIEDPTSDVWLCDAQDAALTACCPTKINPVTSAKVCDCVGQAPENDGYTITPECEERDVDECSVAAQHAQGPCHPNAVCQNLDGASGPDRYRCICPPGMLGDGVSRCDVKDYLTTFEFGIAGSPPASFDESAVLDGLYASQVIPASVDRSRVNATAGVYRADMETRRSASARKLLDSTSQDENASEAGGSTSSWPETYGDATAGANENAGAQPDYDDATMGGDENSGHDDAAARRRLLWRGKRRQVTQEGTQVKVVIRSASPEEMENTTSAVDTGNLDPAYTVLAEPSSEVSIIDTAFAPIEVDVAGFTVDSIVYSKVNYKWVVTARYKPDVADTVTGIYVSRVGPPPYGTAVVNSFFPSQHPCVVSLSVCCLNDWKDNYIVGSFAGNITQAIGACDAPVQALPTRGLFDPALDEQYVDGLFADYPNSDVFRTGPGRVQLVIAETDLRNSFSTREEILAVPGQTYTGYKLEFFVGMAYFTLLPTNAMSTTVSQTKVTVVVTDSLTFSFSSKQDYTFLRYMTMSLYQNRWIDGIVERRMQFARVAIVLPVGMRQNTRTGLIPTGSIRFAIARALPDQQDQSQWFNPCYSDDDTGMWDDPALWRPLYASAAAQSCAMQHSMCTNPPAEILTSNVIEFNFPIGDELINSTHAQANSGFSLYVYFDVSAIDTSGRVVTTRLFAQAGLHELSVARACESLETTLSLLELTHVDVAIGLVGNEEDWATSVYEADNVRQASIGGSLLDTTLLRNHSVSLQSGLVTLAVRGDPPVFQSPLTSAYYIEIEHLTTIHFLDAAKFDVVRDLMVQSGTGFTVLKDTATDTLGIQLSQQVWDACSSAGGALSCAIRHDIVKNQVRNPTLVHPFATGPATTDETATRDWITRNLLGVSGFSEALAANMTSLVRSKYGIDDRINRAWYINPGHAWPRQTGAAQSALLLSDKLIVIAVIALRDGDGSIVRRRLMSTAGPPDAQRPLPLGGTSVAPQRRQKRKKIAHVDAAGSHRALLQIPSDGSSSSSSSSNVLLVPKTNDQEIVAAMQFLERAPLVEAIPPISFGVPPGESVSAALGVDPASSGTVRVSLVARFPADWDEGRVREAIQRRLVANQKMFCPSCTGVYPVFYDLERHAPGQPGAASSSHYEGRRRGERSRVRTYTRGRALLQQALPALDDFRGTVDVVVAYVGERNEILFTEMFRSLFRDTYSALPVDLPRQLAGGEILVSSVDPAPWASSAQQGTLIVRDSFDSKRADAPAPGPAPSASWDNGAPPPSVDPTSPSAEAVAASPGTTPTQDSALELIANMTDASGASRTRQSALDVVFTCVLFLAASLAIGAP